MTLQEKIRFLRYKYKISIRTIAEESGVGYSSLQHISSGSRTGLTEENLIKVNKYLEQFSFPESFD